MKIDEQRLQRARASPGTPGLDAADHRAAKEVVRSALRRRLAERIRSGRGIDRGEDMLEASRSR